MIYYNYIISTIYSSNSYPPHFYDRIVYIVYFCEILSQSLEALRQTTNLFNSRIFNSNTEMAFMLKGS